MKKHIIFSVLVAGFLATTCSPRKDRFANRSYQSFVAYYNTLFHGKEALKGELKTQKNAHKDRFEEGYIDIFVQNSLVLPSESMGLGTNFFNDAIGTPDQKNQNLNSLQRAEQKALKAIEKHSMVFGGVEKNKEIFEAYMLLAETQMYQGKLSESLEIVRKIYQLMPDDKRLPLAKIHEAFVQSRLKNYTLADEIFFALQSDKNLDKKYQKLLSIYHAEHLLKMDKKEEALEELEKAFVLNKNRETRSRIAFLRGQVLASMNRKEEARESFLAAYKYANNFEFEVKSQIEIAKTFTEKDNYEEAKKYIEKISKKGVYAPQKNEFYYALGLLAQNSNKEEEAQRFFHQSVREKASDPHIRGLAYFEIGKNYLKKENYIKAGAYYDSAKTSIEHAPTKARMEEIAENIKKISDNYYLVKKNDSILMLTKMSPQEKTAFFQKHIEKLKEQEAKAAAEKEKSKKKRKSSENFSHLANFETFGEIPAVQKNNKFYFANASMVERGSQNFRRIWNDRSLNDNWRYESNIPKKQVSEDLENETLGRDPADARRYEVDYYLESIPTEESAIATLKKDRDSASLGLGEMYEAYFQNTPLATKTLYDLVEKKPNDKIRLQALYLIFSMNHEKNPAQAEKAKTLILRDFPKTPYAEFVKNPKKGVLYSSNEEIKKSYEDAYERYTDEQFSEAQKIITQSISQYPSDALVPKFELLEAFIIGKTNGKEEMIKKLKLITLHYEKTLEGIKAKEVLDILSKTEEKKESVGAKTEEKSIMEEPQKQPVRKESENVEIIEDTPPSQAPKKTEPVVKPETPKKDNPNKRLERPVQTWEKDFLKPNN